MLYTYKFGVSCAWYIVSSIIVSSIIGALGDMYSFILFFYEMT